jgi:hypothetical protein
MKTGLILSCLIGCVLLNLHCSKKNPTKSGPNGKGEIGVTYVGSYPTPGWPRGMTIAGNRAYLTYMKVDSDSIRTGLQIVNISNPSHPTLIGSYDSLFLPGAVAVVGNYAYVIGLYDYYNVLQVIDVLTPSEPILVGSCKVQSNISGHGLAVVGNYAYVTFSNGLQIIDIGNPHNPSPLGTYQPLSFAEELDVVGDYAYVLDASGLKIINVSDPYNPTLIGSYPKEKAYSMAVAGKYAYVTYLDWDPENMVVTKEGLLIIKVSDPFHPALAGSYDGMRARVTVAENYVYLAEGYYVLIINVSNPSSPTLACSYRTTLLAVAELAVVGSYLYVADMESSGLKIFHISER